MSQAASPESNRRRNFELRAIMDFLVDLARRSDKSAYDCIIETYDLVGAILKEGKDLSVSGELLNTFETNRHIIYDIYNPTQRRSKTLSAQLALYFQRLLGMKDLVAHDVGDGRDIAEFHAQVDRFLRDYIIHSIGDERVVFLLAMTVLYRQLQERSTADMRSEIETLSVLLQQQAVRPDKAVSILIYNSCQDSVDAIRETDLARATLLCERAVELFKIITPASKIKEAIRGQIEEAMRVTTERLINRIQERSEEEQVAIVESLVAQLISIDLIAYLMPQLVFFLIRAQKYEECIEHLETVLQAQNLSGDFLDYQTAITLGYEWCDSLLKAERYSRGKVDFSFIEKEKGSIQKVFELACRIRVPDMEDETFFNVELEKLAVTFSHLGTLFFRTGRLDMAILAYQKSYDTIALKKCSRNRDSVDEILDRYKDTLHHPLNSAPPEAHALIAVLASDKGYDVLLDVELRRLERDGTPSAADAQSFATITHPQKEMIADLMDSVNTKLRFPFAKPFEPYRPVIEERFHTVKKKMKFAH